MLPGVLFFIAMVGYQSEIANVALPSAFLLAKLGAPWFEWAFQIAVLLTLVDTGVAHAARDQRARGEGLRGTAAADAACAAPGDRLTVMVISVYAAGAIGLVDLIAKGYGWLTYAFIVLLIIPVLTVGLWRLRRLPSLLRQGPQVQVLVVEAEVRQRRDGAHADAVDRRRPP